MNSIANKSAFFFEIACAVGVLGAAYGPQARAQSAIGEESLLGHAVQDQALVFRVHSGGCTSKADFGLETVGKKPLTVRLLRLRADYCEARQPGWVDIKFTFAEIGAGPKLSASEQKDLVILNDAK